MPERLGFNPEAYYNRGKLQDKDSHACTVWEAIMTLKEKTPERWEAMAQEIFEASNPTPETVLLKIKETDTCTDLSSSPVEVWIDPEGTYTLWVN